MDKEGRPPDPSSAEHPDALRVWLRLRTCTQLIENQIRTGLRDRFGSTLPRFDFLAQLAGAPDGLKMNELSRRLMVTGGNVTGVTDQLVCESLVERVAVPGDRRACRIKLTAKGREQLSEMASEHEAWVADAFTGLSTKDITSLQRLLSRLSASACPAPRT